MPDMQDEPPLAMLNLLTRLNNILERLIVLYGYQNAVRELISMQVRLRSQDEGLHDAASHKETAPDVVEDNLL
ncbi:hypothetical protein EPA93_00245 [Ktedonosporobacter rubrisoli]|uniref:Uncharacterized protein n=1 Tax=Ktedonosporobacter rubrisoli TaxID=2509675 RepID=A0A4P6JHM2_KTERU|nr:hypothetical protein [Ktedonosporobacter rubrisoli]QBD74507.1 hypothetical protein EPA93_00245 [Ktedonosporobacter rubrisoli]